jgi:hypothetical protein
MHSLDYFILFVAVNCRLDEGQWKRKERVVRAAFRFHSTRRRYQIEQGDSFVPALTRLVVEQSTES